VVLITVFMLISLVVAALVLVYVAFPHRGHDLPAAPWVSDAMRRGVAALPTVDNLEGRTREDSRR
jgi:hypothetical protein